MDTTNDDSNKCCKCCKKHYPRCPYTHVEERFDSCCIGCDKPGIGSSEHNPGDNDCSNDCALLYCPCALILDIFCFPFMVFGYYNVEKP
jgi:hypothetical protein